MSNLDGFTHAGLKTALDIKENYKKGEPIYVPGDENSILVPEYLLNHHLDLQSIEDPIALAMMATRDPEAPMALAAAARMSPLGRKTKLLAGVYGVVGETTRHPLVQKCIAMITDKAFDPDAIASIRGHASKFITQSRRDYTGALRENLKALLDGSIAPRLFVRQFFELTEAGNMRTEIRKKLVVSLLLSANVRPAIKFLFLEHLSRFPTAVRNAIITAVVTADPSHHMDVLKDEIRWILNREKREKKPQSDFNASAMSPSQGGRKVDEMRWN